MSTRVIRCNSIFRLQSEEAATATATAAAAATAVATVAATATAAATRLLAQDHSCLLTNVTLTADPCDPERLDDKGKEL